MNLPNYLAPAPLDLEKEVERAHGFDFPFRASSPSWADPNQDFSAPCRCGEIIRVSQISVQRAIQTFSPFRAKMEEHQDQKAVDLRFVYKWGGAISPLDNGVTAI